jgi:SAM-dependent methyltransferase
MDSYRDDLAYVHDAGFGRVAESAARLVLEFLAAKGQPPARLLDLGCGTGIFAQVLAAHGHHVTGMDISPGMLRIARRRIPHGDFRQESFVSATLPRCDVATGIGEVFNYLFDRRHNHRQLLALFQRVYQSLPSGGLFLFDMAEPGRGGTRRVQRFVDAGEWVCLVEVEEDRQKRILTRRITTFRHVGNSYRRDDETHRQRLYPRGEILRMLRRIGFRARTLSAYGSFRFPKGMVGYWARKK